jgi:hypothetical protein
MSESVEQGREGLVERSARKLRNVTAVGFVALEGAALLAPPLAVAAAGSLLIALGSEIIRGSTKQHRRN